MTNEDDLNQGFESNQPGVPEMNFSRDATRYRVKDPYKKTLLEMMGAKCIGFDARDRNKIMFVLEHPHIVELVQRIHNGQLGQQETSNQTYGLKLKATFDTIRDIKNGRFEKVKP